MTRPTLIVIGAGLGGLSTGIYAQRNGYQCRIFEHARHPGGVIPTLVSGKHAAMLMCRRDDKAFRVAH